MFDMLFLVWYDSHIEVYLKERPHKDGAPHHGLIIQSKREAP